MMNYLLGIFTCFSFAAFGQYCMTGVGPTSTADSNVELVQLSGASGVINYAGCPGIIGVQDLTALSVKHG